MAKIKLEIVFSDPAWKPIKIEAEGSDKSAYRIYRLVIPKKTDFPETNKKPEVKA